MKIFGNPASTCTRKVLTALAETKTPHEFVRVDFTTGEHKAPDHMKRQPFGQVPALEDDGFAMYESRAMCRYINEKSGGKLVPNTAQGRAQMEQWISIETSNFTPSAMTQIYQHIFRSPQTPEALDKATTKLDTALATMNDHLAKNDYFAGDFSIADISFMPYVEYLMATPVKEQVLRYPHVASWWNRVSERPSWRTATGRG